MLEVRDISVAYGAIKALHGVSLSVAKGEIVTLIGCNGAGKSTTLRAISGLVRPGSGDILYEGRTLRGVAPHEIVRLGLAHSPEGRGVFPNMTVSENLDLGAYARKSSEHAQIRVDRERALDLFPRLRERLRQSAGTLSGGEQQMLAMGRALMSRPKLLLMDEPSMGLAPKLVEQNFELIQQVNQQGTTVFMVEQNANMALSIAHRGYVVQTGRIVLADEAKNLLDNEQLRKAYLGR